VLYSLLVDQAIVVWIKGARSNSRVAAQSPKLGGNGRKEQWKILLGVLAYIASQGCGMQHGNVEDYHWSKIEGLLNAILDRSNSQEAHSTDKSDILIFM